MTTLNLSVCFEPTISILVSSERSKYKRIQSQKQLVEQTYDCVYLRSNKYRKSTTVAYILLDTRLKPKALAFHAVQDITIKTKIWKNLKTYESKRERVLHKNLAKKRQLRKSCWGSVALLMLTKQKLVKTIILPSRLGVLWYFVSPSFTAGYRVRERWLSNTLRRLGPIKRQSLRSDSNAFPPSTSELQRHSHIYLRGVCSSSFKEKSQFTGKIQSRRRFWWIVTEIQIQLVTFLLLVEFYLVFKFVATRSALLRLSSTFGKVWWSFSLNYSHNIVSYKTVELK